MNINSNRVLVLKYDLDFDGCFNFLNLEAKYLNYADRYLFWFDLFLDLHFIQAYFLQLWPLTKQKIYVHDLLKKSFISEWLAIHTCPSVPSPSYWRSPIQKSAL